MTMNDLVSIYLTNICLTRDNPRSKRDLNLTTRLIHFPRSIRLIVSTNLYHIHLAVDACCKVAGDDRVHLHLRIVRGDVSVRMKRNELRSCRTNERASSTS